MSMSKKWKKVCIYLQQYPPSLLGHRCKSTATNWTQICHEIQQLSEAELRWNGTVPAPHPPPWGGRGRTEQPWCFRPQRFPSAASSPNQKPHHTPSAVTFPRSQVSRGDVHLSTDRMLKDKVRCQLSKLRPRITFKMTGKEQDWLFSSQYPAHSCLNVCSPPKSHTHTGFTFLKDQAVKSSVVH